MQSRLKLTRSMVLSGVLAVLACIIIAGIALSANVDAHTLSIGGTETPLSHLQNHPERYEAVYSGRDLQRSRFKVPQDAPDAVQALEEGVLAAKGELPEPLQIDCRGEAAHERGCRLDGLWYDTKNQVFVVESAPGEAPLWTSGTKSQAAAQRAADSLRGLFNKPWAPIFETAFSGVSGTSKRPARSNTCMIDFPVHLRASLRTQSFGHIIRDNFYGLTAVPRQFEEQSSDYAWVTWPRRDSGNAFKIAKIVFKYASWLGNPRVLPWWNLMKQFCEAEDGGTKRFVYFGKVLVSSGGNDWTAEESSACKNADFMAMRDIAYTTAGIKHVPVKDQKEKRVVFIARLVQGERRGMFNVEEAAEQLRKSLPGVKVEVHWMARDHVDPQEQLEITSKTTVMVANIGSASFRQFYLPDGAHAILVGPPSDKFTGADGEAHRIGHPFRELDRCFKDAKHWTVHPFQATLSEVALDPGREAKIPAAGIDAMPQKYRREYETKRMWDASVRLNVKKLTSMVRECLGEDE